MADEEQLEQGDTTEQTPPEVAAEASADADVEAESEPAAEAGAAAEAEPVEDAQEAEAPAASATKKRKRLPRALRPQRAKPKREKPQERKPIVRLAKPEHVRGRRQERQGTVVSSAPDKTIVVRVDVIKVHPRYKKVIRRSTKLHAHDESNEAKVGDLVRVVETRPVSRLKRWRLQEIVRAAR
jgi:small subunit ribosomal protein S17